MIALTRSLILLGMGPEILGELVEIGIGDRGETGLVDVAYDLDAHLFQFRSRRSLQVEHPLRLLKADVPRRRLHPAFLLYAEALPKLVADPEDGVVGFVLGHRQHGRHFIMAIDQVDVDGILAEIHHAGLQGGVDAAERHMHGLRAIGGKHGVLGRGRLHAHLVALEVIELAHLAPAVDVPEALRAEPDGVNARDGFIDQVTDGFEHLLIASALML